MASAAENEIAINAIQTELANSVKVDALTGAQRREMMDGIFPNGFALYASDPQVKTGDWVFGEDISGINSGNFFIGIALADGAATTSGDVNIRLG